VVRALPGTSPSAAPPALIIAIVDVGGASRGSGRPPRPPTGAGPSRRVRHNWAVPVEMSRERFEELVAEALDEVPEGLLNLMSNVVILVEDDPNSSVSTRVTR
jgi:hypothetical protein